MFHWYVVGHIDPLDPVDTSGLPHKPKIQRPISREMAKSLENKFGRDIDEYVSFEEPGFVVCNWWAAPHTVSGRVQEFAFLLAEHEGAMVMDERFMILWPGQARVANQRWWTSHA
jgi:hypothetical protein